MEERIKFSENGRILTSQLEAEIDHHSAKRVREKIDRAMFEFKPDTLVLDFSEVKFMDSSGIALIIGRSVIAEEMGANVILAGLSKTLVRLVRISGIEKIRNISII